MNQVRVHRFQVSFACSAFSVGPEYSAQPVLYILLAQRIQMVQSILLAKQRTVAYCRMSIDSSKNRSSFRLLIGAKCRLGTRH